MFSSFIKVILMFTRINEAILMNLQCWNLLYFGKGTSHQLWFFLTALIWSIIILFIFLTKKKTKCVLTLSFIFEHLRPFRTIPIQYSYKISSNTRDAIFFGLFYTTSGIFFAYHSNLWKILENKYKRLSLFIFLSFHVCKWQRDIFFRKRLYIPENILYHHFYLVFFFLCTK